MSSARDGMDKICPRDVSRVLVRDVARTIAEYLVNGAGVMFHDIVYIFHYVGRNNKLYCREMRNLVV